MEAVRQIIDSKLLDKITLPSSLRNRKVEIIVLPVEENQYYTRKGVDDLVGILEQYKNPSLMHLEKDAWEMAVKDKHGAN